MHLLSAKLGREMSALGRTTSASYCFEHFFFLALRGQQLQRQLQV